MKWSSCCRGRDNCPQIAIKDFIYIRDDHGSQVKFTAEEYALVSKQIREEMLQLANNPDAQTNPDFLKLFGAMIPKPEV